MMEKMDENQHPNHQSDPLRPHPLRSDTHSPDARARANSAPPENSEQRPRPPVYRTQAQRELAQRRAQREAARAQRAQGREAREAKRRAEREAAARKEAEKQARARAREEQYLAARGRLQGQVDNRDNGHADAGDLNGEQTLEPYAPRAKDFDQFSTSVERRAAGRAQRQPDETSGQPDETSGSPADPTPTRAEEADREGDWGTTPISIDTNAETSVEPDAGAPAFRRPHLRQSGDGERPVIVVPRPVGWSRILLVSIGAALLSWLIPAVVAVIAFLLTASNSWVLNLDLSDAMVIGTDVWALSSFAVVAKNISIVPLGLTLINLLIAVLALRSTHVESLLTTAIFIPTYLLTSTLIGAFAHSHASLRTIAAGSCTVAILAWTALNRRRLWKAAELWTHGRFTYPRQRRKENSPDRFDAPSEHFSEDNDATLRNDQPALAHAPANPPADLLPALRRGAADALVTLGGVATGSIIALGVSTWLNWRKISGISQLVVHSVSDTIMVWLAQLMYLPNALGWTAAWGTGAGFYLGSDTIHIPSRAPANPIPAIPMFGAVPGAPTGNWVVLVPITVGLIFGVWMMRRRQERTLAEQLVHAVSTLVVFATISGLWMWLSGGSLASARLSLLGPRWLLATTLLTAQVALVATTVYLLSYSRVRSYLGGRGYEASLQVRQVVSQTRKGGAGWLPWSHNSDPHEDGANPGSDGAPAPADPVGEEEFAHSTAPGSPAETGATAEVEGDQEENIEDIWKILDGGNLASAEAQDAGELAQAVPEEYLVEELQALNTQPHHPDIDGAGEGAPGVTQDPGSKDGEQP